MRKFTIALLLLCLIMLFGCNDSESGRFLASSTPPPAPGHPQNTSSTPLKENTNQQGNLPPATLPATPSMTNKVTESSPPAQKKSNWDPNYSGCVPIASDVDCASGGGNGPEYVDGPVRVIGNDIYKLDRDGDGIACEN